MLQTLFLSLFVVLCFSKEFIGKNTPQKSIEELFSKVNYDKIVQDYTSKKMNVPGMIQFMQAAQSGGAKKFFEMLPFKDFFLKNGYGAMNEKSEYKPNLSQTAAEKMAQAAKANTSSNKDQIKPGQNYTADDGCVTSKNVTTEIITTICPTGVTTTLNPKTNETTSHDPLSGIFSYVDPPNNFTISINNHTFVTTQVNTTTGQTILFNNRTGVVSIFDNLLGISIVHDVPRNSTTVTNSTAGEVKLIKILAGLYIITTVNPNRTITFDFQAKTVTFETTVDGETTTVVKEMTDALIKEYNALQTYPVPTPLETVHSIFETIYHPNIQKKVVGPSVAISDGKVIVPDVYYSSTVATNPSLSTLTSEYNAKTQEELDKKAQIQQKVDEKIKKVEKDVVPHIYSQCSSGGCCDTKTGKFRPIGTPCRESECSGSSTCLGVSGHCPPALPSAYLANGTACTGGHCQSGVCVKDDHKATTKAQIDELRAKKLAEAKKDTTTSEPIMVHGLKVEMKCTTGGCCDLTKGLIKPAGSQCTFSKHECFEAVGICNGYESKCERKAMKDGTQCDGGKGTCKDGSCVLSPLSTSDTLTHSSHQNNDQQNNNQQNNNQQNNNQQNNNQQNKDHQNKAETNAEAIEKAMALAKRKAEEFESAENAARNEELDLNMAELEAKIEKAKERQKRIKETMIQQEHEENKRALRTMFDHIHKIVKQEHGIAKQSLYPYQTTMTKEEANDKAHSGFNIHDYIKNIAEEDYRYNKETLALANEKLKSNNGTYKRFPWYAAALFGVFVVGVALIVGIMKISKSGGKSKKVIKDDEYENF